MKYQTTRENVTHTWTFPPAVKLILCFGSLCGILAAIGGVFFFGLHAIERLNGAARSSAMREIAIPTRLGKNLDLQQAAVFQHLAATNAEERKRYEEVIVRLAQTYEKNLAEYEKTCLDTEADKQRYAKVLLAGKAYSDQTEQLLALSRAQRTAETAAFALTAQVPAFYRYQTALDALLGAEKEEGEDFAVATTGRIERTRILGDILIGLAIAIALGTGAVVARMVRKLKRDKENLQTAVDDYKHAEHAVHEGEARLRQADEKYRSIFENASEGIFQNTPQGKLISANPSLARMLGYDSPEELIRERHDVERQGYAEPARRQEFKRMLEEQGVVENFEYEVKRKDGSTIWVSENVRIVRDGSGSALYYEGSAQDITKRKRAEVLLLESGQRLSLATESAHIGIWDWNVVTNELVWDAKMYALYGIRARDFSGAYDAWQNGLHPDDRKRSEEEISRAVSGDHGFHTEFRVIWPGGEIRNIEAHGVVQRDSDGAAAHMIGANWDITKRKQAEQKLMEQADLLNLAQDAIMVRGMDDRIQFWNHGAEALYGWTAEEARGRLTCDVLQYEEPVKILAERILFETGSWSGECRHLTKAGNSVIVRSRWTLVRDEQGQPKSKLVIATDMTEQKKIEEQFLRAQRLESIGTLASGVAHDLNNILAPIMMAAPILREETDPAERERFLDLVESSASRGADVIKQMLTFARGADGDHILLQPIYLLEEVSKIAGRTFPKSIALRTCYDENIRSLEADPTQLHQVLLNLCINARDAMPNGGDLCLGAENFDVDERCASMNAGATVGPHVMLQVTDTGSGIPTEVIDKIFDPFFTTKSIGHGTGLGLSTVAGIVRSHGGFIRVESEPGRTSFKIFLPAKAALTTASALKVDALIPQGNGETILLVDDEPSIREVAALILTSHGYKVLLAEDGSSALALFAREMGHVAVVITDLAMPGMDGLMLVRTLRRMQPTLKIIVSTGRTDESNAAEIAALNIDGSITKPYTTRSLLLKLSHVLHSGMQDAA